MLPEAQTGRLPILEASVEQAMARSAATLVVGLGEAGALSARADVDEALVAYGLGSCVAICLWDAASQVAAMAHVVLPGTDPRGKPNPRFARSAVPALVALMQRAGAGRDPRRYVAKLAGGAQVLNLGGSGGLPRVGEQNAAAVLEALAETGVPVRAHDLGGSRGRSVWFDPRQSGQIRVRAIGSQDRYL